MIERVIAQGEPLEDARRDWDACEAGFREPVTIKPFEAILLFVYAATLAFAYHFLVRPMMSK